MQETARNSKAFPTAAGNSPPGVRDFPHGGDVPIEMRDDRTAAADEAEMNISHFIPSLELKGSRAHKLMQLDTLIAYLQRLRVSLAGDADAVRSTYEGPSRYIDAPAWPWLVAGIVLGALFVVLLVVAWSYVCRRDAARGFFMHS
jgi:hypothetical protein